MADVGHKRIARGKGWHNTGAAIVAADQGGEQFEGTEAVFGNYDPTITTPRIRQRRDNSDVVCKLVRNESGITLLPKRAVKWKSGQRGKAVDRYCTSPKAGDGVVLEVAGIVDEFWPAGGVPDGELFWIVVKGQTLWITGVGETAADISVGDWLVSGTATATTGTAGDEGTPDNQVLNAATERLGAQVQNRVAVALSACTSQGYGVDILVDVHQLN